MKKIKLENMNIRNFKGCDELNIVFSDTTNIYGRNASGKTTVADAFTWLLFDKDSQGKEKFQVRPLDESGKQIDNVEIAVEAALSVDGNITTLKKVQKQNWVKKRGSDDAVLDGNINEYSINDFPALEKDFKALVASIIPEDLFRLLTDPKMFPSLLWKKQREMLLQFVGEITDADVLAGNPVHYKVIAEDLKLAPVEKCIEKAKKQLAALRDKQKELPVRIDEAHRSIKETPVSLAELELQKNALNEKLAEIQQEKDGLSGSFKAVDEIQSAIIQVKMDMSEIERKANADLIKAKQKARQKHDELQAVENTAMQEYRRKKARQQELTGQIQQEKENLDRLLTEKAEFTKQFLKARSAEMPEDMTFCDKCGQELPADKLEEVRTVFEKNKKAKVDRMFLQGKQMKESCDKKAAKIAEMEAQVEELEGEIPVAKSAWDASMTKTSRAYLALDSMPEKVDVTGTPEYLSLAEKESELKEKLAGMTTQDGRKAVLNQREQAVRAELEKVAQNFATIEANSVLEERIAELTKEQKKVAQQAAEQEQKLYLLEEFSHEKMNWLSESINKHFNFVKFKLFDIQINGGIKDTCEMVVDGVPYGSLNSAAKMQAGLDVINSLSRLYDVSAPVWLDNRESVTSIPPVDAQIINLIVSAADEKMRIE